MSDDYLWDRAGAPDPAIAGLEQLLAPLAHDAQLADMRDLRGRRVVQRPRRRAPWIVGAGALVAAAAVAVVLVERRGGDADDCRGGAGFAFQGRGGDVTCGGTSLAAGVLPVGGNLDTGAHEADLTIANIGAAQLGPHTRVHLAHVAHAGSSASPGATDHQLVLDLGHLHAKVNAPPRLFVIETASTRVTDLGCEYTIDVDASGAGAIAVQVGQVELATKSDAVVLVPSLMHASILAGREPGIPLRDAAPDALVAAAHAYEHGAPAAFAALLAAATADDALTIVALAAIDVPRRAQALARLAELFAPPAGVTIDAATHTPAALVTWRDAIVAAYFGGDTHK